MVMRIKKTVLQAEKSFNSHMAVLRDKRLWPKGNIKTYFFKCMILLFFSENLHLEVYSE